MTFGEVIAQIAVGTAPTVLAAVGAIFWAKWQKLGDKVSKEDLKAVTDPIANHTKEVSEMVKQLETRVNGLPTKRELDLELQRRDDEFKRVNKRLDTIEQKIDDLPEKMTRILKTVEKE